MQEQEFRKRAELIHCPESLKRKILTRQRDGSYLFWQFEDGKMFQIRHCEDLVAGRYVPPAPVFQPAAHTQQTVAYQQFTPQYQAYFQQQPVKRKKKNNKNALITAAILAGFVLVVALFFSFSGTSFSDLLNMASGNSQPSDAPTSCGENSVYMSFEDKKSKEDGNLYYMPNSVSPLKNDPSAICFIAEEMSRFYAQTNIPTASGQIDGHEALSRAILNKTLSNTDPRYVKVYETLKSALDSANFQTFQDDTSGRYRFVRLPGLNEFSIAQPTTTSVARPTSTYQPVIPTVTPFPATPTAPVMAMQVIEDTPTSIPLPTIKAQWEANNVAIATLIVAYDVTPMDTSNITPIAGPPAVTLQYMVDNNLLRYGACSIIPDAGSFSDFSQRWPMDNVFTMYLGGMCGEGEGTAYVVQLPSGYQSHHLNDPRYRNIHISTSPYDNWGPAMQIPGTSYYIQPFNP